MVAGLKNMENGCIRQFPACPRKHLARSLPLWLGIFSLLANSTPQLAQPCKFQVSTIIYESNKRQYKKKVF